MRKYNDLLRRCFYISVVCFCCIWSHSFHLSFLFFYMVLQDFDFSAYFRTSICFCQDKSVYANTFNTIFLCVMGQNIKKKIKLLHFLNRREVCNTQMIATYIKLCVVNFYLTSRFVEAVNDD